MTIGFSEAVWLWPNFAPSEVRRIFGDCGGRTSAPQSAPLGSPLSSFTCLMQSVLQDKTSSAISGSSNVSSGLKNTKGYFTGIKVCHYTLYCVHCCDSCCRFGTRMKPLLFLFSFTKRQSLSLGCTAVTLANIEHVCLELHTGLKIPRKSIIKVCNYDYLNNKAGTIQFMSW